MAAWEFCLQDGGVSEGFTHKMAARELCLQDGGVSEGLPTRWRCGSFAYNMAAFLRVFPQDGGNAKQIKRKQKQRRICFQFTV